MIMSKEENSGASMQQPTVHAPEGELLGTGGVVTGKGRLLQQRLELIEDLWQAVLRSECPAEQCERVLRLKQLSDPLALDGRDGDSSSEIETVSLGTYINGAIGNRTCENHAVCASTAVDGGCCDRAGEQQQVGSTITTYKCAVVDTSCKAQGVLIITAKN